MKLGNHPSEKRLLAWSERGRPSRTARHLQHCSLCEERLESLTQLSTDERVSLEAVLAPPQGLQERTSERLKKLLDQETLLVLSDLMRVGWQTSRVLLEEENEDE